MPRIPFLRGRQAAKSVLHADAVLSGLTPGFASRSRRGFHMGAGAYRVPRGPRALGATSPSSMLRNVNRGGLGRGYLGGGPLAAEGRRTASILDSTARTFGNMRKAAPLAAAPPPREASRLARHGKMVAAGVVAAGVGGMAARSRSGRGTDRIQGRPTGLFNY